MIGEKDTQVYYGEPSTAKRTGWPCAYMLLYESEDMLKEFYIDELRDQSGVPQSNDSRQQPHV